MDKIKAVVVDDEPLARDMIKVFLRAHPQIELAGEAENGFACVDMVNELKPELLFLDIQMPELNGFDALKEMDGQTLPTIVFTTAYDKYALKAFEASAIDYLLKPFHQERFDLAIEKSLRYLHVNDKNSREAERTRIIEHYEALIRQNNSKPIFAERLMVRENKKLLPVPVNQVLVFQADADYVVLNLAETPRKYLINNSLSNLESMLDPDRYIRIHKSTIIRIDGIAEMRSHTNGEYVMQMKNGMEVKLSRTYRHALKKISSYTF